MSKEDDLISGLMDSTNGNFSSAVFIAFVHIAQVRPAAVRFADLNCADAEMVSRIDAINICIAFMIMGCSADLLRSCN